MKSQSRKSRDWLVSCPGEGHVLGPHGQRELIQEFVGDADSCFRSTSVHRLAIFDIEVEVLLASVLLADIQDPPQRVLVRLLAAEQ